MRFAFSREAQRVLMSFDVIIWNISETTIGSNRDSQMIFYITIPLKIPFSSSRHDSRQNDSSDFVYHSFAMRWLHSSFNNPLREHIKTTHISLYKSQLLISFSWSQLKYETMIECQWRWCKSVLLQWVALVNVPLLVFLCIGLSLKVV